MYTNRDVVCVCEVALKIINFSFVFLTENTYVVFTGYLHCVVTSPFISVVKYMFLVYLLKCNNHEKMLCLNPIFILNIHHLKIFK